MERCYMEAFLFVFLYQCLFSSDKVRVNKNKQTHTQKNQQFNNWSLYFQ